MITAVWSDDPEFYNIIAGGSDILYHVFIKINYTDTDKIVKRFNLKEISDGIYTRSDTHKYICIKTNENVETALRMVRDVKAKL